MSEQLITNDKSILSRYGRNSKPLMPEPENPTPRQCPVCQEKQFPKLIHRKIVYIHQCKARLKSGKAISKKLKY